MYRMVSIQASVQIAFRDPPCSNRESLPHKTSPTLTELLRTPGTLFQSNQAPWLDKILDLQDVMGILYFNRAVVLVSQTSRCNYRTSAQKRAGSPSADFLSCRTIRLDQTLGVGRCFLVDKSSPLSNVSWEGTRFGFSKYQFHVALLVSQIPHLFERWHVPEYEFDSPVCTPAWVHVPP